MGIKTKKLWCVICDECIKKDPRMVIEPFESHSEAEFERDNHALGVAHPSARVEEFF